MRGYYWIARATTSANWWLWRYDLRTARRFLRYAFLALRGRIVVVDERVVESCGGYTYLQLDISPLPLQTGQCEPVGATDDYDPGVGLLFRRSWPH